MNYRFAFLSMAAAFTMHAAAQRFNISLTQAFSDLGVQVKCQLEDIFDKMHRI